MNRLSRGPSWFGEFGNDQRQGIPITVTAKPPSTKASFSYWVCAGRKRCEVCLSVVTVSEFVY